MKFIAAMSLLFTLSVAHATSPKVPGVAFVQPSDNQVVPQTFPVEFVVTGMAVAKAGVMTKETGHHHVIIDGKAIPKGQVVPMDETHKHFGDGSTKTMLTLKPGKHTLTLQFADGAHKSYGEEFSKTINVEVK